jgi:hypothetical protein
VEQAVADAVAKPAAAEGEAGVEAADALIRPTLKLCFGP